MISAEIKKQITDIWDDYIKSNKAVVDTKGVEFDNIDNSRNNAIIEIKSIINAFLKGNSSIYEFKTTLHYCPIKT